MKGAGQVRTYRVEDQTETVPGANGDGRPDAALTPPAPAEEGRRAKRLRPPMHCYWGMTEACPRNGKITSLSTEGCFVKTKAEPDAGRTVFVNCWLPTEHWLTLRGTVTYHLPRVGFNLVFADLSETEAEMLALILEFHEDDAAA